MTKAPHTNRNVKRAKRQHKQRHKKGSIKQQLRTDFGSVGVTTATQLVWLTWFTGPPFDSPQQPCNQRDTHLKMCKKTSLYRQQTNSHTKRRGHKNQYTNSIVNK